MNECNGHCPKKGRPRSGKRVIGKSERQKSRSELVQNQQKVETDIFIRNRSLNRDDLVMSRIHGMLKDCVRGKAENREAGEHRTGTV